MSRKAFLVIAFVLTIFAFSSAETIKSTFVAEGFGGSLQGSWELAESWNPAGVPNNTVDDTFDVSIGDSESGNLAFVTLGDAGTRTVQNLEGFFRMNIQGNGTNLTVNGTTSNDPRGSFDLRATGGDIRLALGNLAQFSDGILDGDYALLATGDQVATMSFNGADVRTILDRISLRGERASILDEEGEDALRNLSEVQGELVVSMGALVSTSNDLEVANDGEVFIGVGDTMMTIGGDLSNNGRINLSESENDSDSGGIVVHVEGSIIMGPGSRLNVGNSSESRPISLIVDGTVSSLDGSSLDGVIGVGGLLQFNGNSITTNRGILEFNENTGRIIDGSGEDALANLSLNAEEARLTLVGNSRQLKDGFLNEGILNIFSRAFNGPVDTLVVVDGSFINDGSLTVRSASDLLDLVGGQATFQVNEDFTNTGNIHVDAEDHLATLEVGGILKGAGELRIHGGESDATIELSGLEALVEDTLTMGTYGISAGPFEEGGALTKASLIIPNADIVINQADISFEGEGANIVDEADANALRNFSVNDVGAEFAVASGAHFTTAGDFTNMGKLRVGRRGSFTRLSSTFTITGALKNLSEGTLTNGEFEINSNVFGVTNTITIPGADIVTNAASISFVGPASFILDEEDRNGLRNFAENADGAYFFTNAGFTTAGDFRNDGELVVSYDISNLFDSTFEVTGDLLNFSEGTLSGGIFEFISRSTGENVGTMTFSDADITILDGIVRLTGNGSGFFDSDSTENGLRNLNKITTAGELTLDDHELTTTGNITNNGIVTLIDADLVLGESGEYVQTDGSTELDGGKISAASVTIMQGVLLGSGQIEGDLSLATTATIAVGLGGISRGSSYDSIVEGGSSSLVLNGILEIQFKDGFESQVSSSDSFIIFESSEAIDGAFSNVASGSRLETIDGAGSFRVEYADQTTVVLSDFQSNTPSGVDSFITRFERILDEIVIEWDPFGNELDYTLQSSPTLQSVDWSPVNVINTGSTTTTISLPEEDSIFYRVTSP